MRRIVDVITIPDDSSDESEDSTIIEPSTESNPVQIQHIVFEDTAKSRPGSSTVADAKITDPENMVAQGKKYIGVLVTKEFDGKSYMGKVQGFSDETNLFKITYANHASEEIKLQELEQIVAPPVLIPGYLERFPDEAEKARVLKRHMPAPDDPFRPIHPRRPYTLAVQPAPKKRKPKTSTSNYVPLAYREKKKDAYVFY